MKRRTSWNRESGRTWVVQAEVYLLSKASICNNKPYPGRQQEIPEPPSMSYALVKRRFLDCLGLGAIWANPSSGTLAKAACRKQKRELSGCPENSSKAGDDFRQTPIRSKMDAHWKALWTQHGTTPEAADHIDWSNTRAMIVQETIQSTRRIAAGLCPSLLDKLRFTGWHRAGSAGARVAHRFKARVRSMLQTLVDDTCISRRLSWLLLPAGGPTHRGAKGYGHVTHL